MMSQELTPQQEEDRKQMQRTIGFIAGLFSKFMLEQGGCEVNFKINGENINDIEKLHKFDITERIKLAVKEERYEDACNLKKLLENKQSFDKK